MNSKEIQLNSNLTIKYIEKIIIDSKEYYKYEVGILSDNSSLKRNIYSDVLIDIEKMDKNRVTEFIMSKINASGVEEDVFVELSTIINTSNNTSSGGASGAGGTSMIALKVSNFYNVTNFEKLDEALTQIRALDECELPEALNTLSDCDQDLEDIEENNKFAREDDTSVEDSKKNNNKISDDIFSIETKLRRLSNGKGPEQVIIDYQSFYETICTEVMKQYATLLNIEKELDEYSIEQLLNAVENGDITYEMLYEEYGNEYESVLKNSVDIIDAVNKIYELEYKDAVNGIDEGRYSTFEEMFTAIGEVDSRFKCPDETAIRDVANAYDVDKIDKEAKWEELALEKGYDINNLTNAQIKDLNNEYEKYVISVQEQHNSMVSSTIAFLSAIGISGEYFYDYTSGDNENNFANLLIRN